MKLILTLLVLTIALGACNKQPQRQELHCPPYDPTFINAWFPYEAKKTYNYKDSVGNKHWLVIDNISYVNGDEPSMGCVPQTECLPGGTMFAYRDQAQYDKIWMNVNHHYDATGNYLDIIWNSIHVYMVINNDGSISLDPKFYERAEDYYRETKPAVFAHHDKISLNGTEYTNTYEIVFNTNDMGNAHKVYFAKGHGVVGYQTQDGIHYWKE